MDTGGKVVGVVLAVIGGLAAIGVCIWFTKTATPLWALILLIIGLERVVVAKKPGIVGLIMGLAYIGLGAVAYYVRSAGVLWAMILVDILAERLV